MASTIVSAVSALVSSKGPHRFEVGRKQLTLALGGLYIASTTLLSKPLLVWETEKGYPRYYIPEDSLHADIKKSLAGGSGSSASVAAIETVAGADGKPHATIERLTVGSKTTTWARFLEGPQKGFVRFERSEIG
jgi:hypothetical protein